MINLNAAALQPFGLASAPSPHPDIGLYFCPLSTLTLTDARMIRLQNILTAAELAQRQAYRTDVLKSNAILSRGLLRLVLAEYLGDAHPQNIGLQQNAYGKPYLPNSRLQFSVSHCHSMLMIALSPARSIGVDIERADQSSQEDLSAFVLAAQESAIQQRLPEAAQAAYFLHCWTRKEAYLKAIGTGLVNHLHLLDTSAHHVVDQGRTTAYQTVAIPVDPQHIASLAYA